MAQTALESSQVGERVDLTGRLFIATEEALPRTYPDLETWQNALTPAAKVNLLGGSYWFVTDLPSVTGREWVFDPYGTLIDRIDTTIYGSDGTLQRLESGYQRPLPYSLHYGNNIKLKPGVQYRAVVRISSPYYAFSHHGSGSVSAARAARKFLDDQCARSADLFGVVQPFFIFKY
jgi:two-component system, sensor histidine kinase LadS